MIPKHEELKQNDELSLNLSYHVLVIVLGDIGRSPRMQYHTLSLLQNNFKVTLIGYAGTPLLSTLETHHNLTTIRFDPYTPSSSYKRITYLALRFIGLTLQLCSLFFLHLLNTKIDCLLVQNPPCIPLLILSFLFSKIKQCNWIIDWHNLGYTMFYNDDQLKQQNKVPKSILLDCIYHYEKYMGNFSNGNFCVSNSMKDWLVKEEFVSSSIEVLYDQPPNFFQKIDLDVMHSFMKRFIDDVIKDECPTLYQRFQDEISDGSDVTLFTERTNNEISLRKNRPFLILSSTSWTPDEDFSILLDALVLFDKELSKSTKMQTILVIVTGKGPLKEYYKNIISTGIKFQNNIHILTPWVTTNDYPIIVSCADIGISLHTSTSGLDLPMKIYDMFGSNIPVLAKHYEPALKELIIDGKNGYVFNDCDDLCKLLVKINIGDAGDCDDPRSLLEQLRNGIELKHWDENWNDMALPFILDLCQKKKKKD